MAESTSPVGNGTAGLLLIKGMPSPPLSGTSVGTATGELALGDGETAWRGRNGHGYVGDEDDTTVPPEVGAGAAAGGNSGDGVLSFSAGVTFMESF